MLTYRLLLGFLSPLILAHVVWRSVRDGGLLYFRQRLGFAQPQCNSQSNSPSGNPDSNPGNDRCLWLHAASVGEVNTALPLIRLLQQRHPALKILVTTNTPTGRQTLQRSIPDTITVCYLPVDFRYAIKRFFRRNNMFAGIILETEIWPNLYHLANCRLAIVNGRLSKRSLRAAEGRAARIYRATLSRLSLVLTRSQADADAFVRIGVDDSKVEVIGNLKFASSAESTHGSELPRFIPQPYCLLASTHDDEELQLARKWLSHHRDELLVIAPRHAERGKTLLRQLQSLTHQIASRSQGDTITAETKIYLADTYGEMQNWYRHANAIFIGGSLIQRGGHNMLEAADMSQSVVTGQHTFNFSAEVNALKLDNAIVEADSSDTIIDQLIVLLDDSALARERGARAKNTINRHADVASNYADRLERWSDFADR